MLQAGLILAESIGYEGLILLVLFGVRYAESLKELTSVTEVQNCVCLHVLFYQSSQYTYSSLLTQCSNKNNNK